MFPKIILEDLRKFTIKQAAIEQQTPFIMKVDRMLSLNQELQQITQGFLQLLVSKYTALTITKRLTHWWLLSFKEFLKELEKLKIKLSLQEQNDG